MKKIKELLVLEGKHDEARMRQLYDCDVILTNGLGIDEKTLEYIEVVAQTRGVIVFTDPDGPGEKIRRKIMERVPSARHCFIERERAIGKRNVGIEYGETDAIIEAIENAVTFSREADTISWAEYLASGMMGATALREKISRKLHIGTCNNKTMFKRLNMLQITAEDLRKLIDEG